jgi:6-pyruvoyltetrahydropterin/6-carboxytetrahydropterin synthase
MEVPSIAGMRLSKEFRFDAAHRIVGHAGRCGWLHGHTYRLSVTVTSPQLDVLDMVMDLDDLGGLVRAAVVDRWDHTVLLRRDDPLVPGVAAVQSAAPERLVLLDRNPTVEVLAREAFAAIRKALPEGVELASVTVWETPTSSSEYRGDD